MMPSLAPPTTITYSRTDGSSGAARVTAGTWIAMEKFYGKKIVDLEDEMTSMEGVARMLWKQIARDEDFDDFYVTLVDLEIDVDMAALEAMGLTLEDPTRPESSQEETSEAVSPVLSQ